MHAEVPRKPVDAEQMLQGPPPPKKCFVESVQKALAVASWGAWFVVDLLLKGVPSLGVRPEHLPSLAHVRLLFFICHSGNLPREQSQGAGKVLGKWQ